MALIDQGAAHELTCLREAAGFNSPEELAAAITRAARTAQWGTRGTVNAWTLRQIEKYGRVPGARIRFVIAHFFGVSQNDIWRPGAGRDQTVVDA